MKFDKLARLTFTAVAGVGLAIAATGARADMDVNKEVSTAATHAGLAAGSKELPMAQMHLHHVINCLVGPKGKGFDAKPGNPCKDQGNGAIPDTTDAAKKQNLEAALASAKAGLKANTLKAAKDEAQKTVASLKKAQ